jgi:DNA-binding MarR family transcriptional regulator
LAKKNEPGRYAYSGLDRLLHERARLSIMTSLMTQPTGLLFNDLKKLCTLTDGNLNRHLEALIKAEYLEVWKKAESVRSQTLYRVTTLGRQNYLAYLKELERLVRDALPTKHLSTEQGPLAGWELA